MARPGPGRQDKQYPRVGAGTHLVALAGIEHGEHARPAAHRVAVALRDLDLTGDDDEMGALVDLVVLELLAGGQVQRDRSRLATARVEDLRLVRLDVEAGQVPVLHAAGKTTSPRAPRAARRSTGGGRRGRGSAGDP